MPYRASGKTVQVMKDGRWVLFKRLASAEAARKMAAALNINVAKKGK